MKDEENIRDRELQRLLGIYTTRTEPIIQRNADRARRRAAGIDGVDVDGDEPVPDPPEVPDTFQAFTDEQQEKTDAFTEA
eukprot:2313869-Amphidinium_carterae.1